MDNFQLTIITIKPTRCTNFSNLFLELNSTCFGHFLCPSSGVFHCTHSDGFSTQKMRHLCQRLLSATLRSSTTARGRHRLGIVAECGKTESSQKYFAVCGAPHETKSYSQICWIEIEIDWMKLVPVWNTLLTSWRRNYFLLNFSTPCI